MKKVFVLLRIAYALKEPFILVFGVRVSVMFHFMFVHYTLSSVWVAEWSPFGK